MTELQVISKLLRKVGLGEPWALNFLSEVGFDVISGELGYVVYGYQERPSGMIEVRNDVELPWAIDLTVVNTTWEYTMVSTQDIAGIIAYYVVNNIRYGVEEFVRDGLEYKLHIMTIPAERTVFAILRFEGGMYDSQW